MSRSARKLRHRMNDSIPLLELQECGHLVSLVETAYFRDGPNTGVIHNQHANKDTLLPLHLRRQFTFYASMLPQAPSSYCRQFQLPRTLSRELTRCPRSVAHSFPSAFRPAHPALGHRSAGPLRLMKRPFR